MKSLELIVPCYNEGEVLPLFFSEVSKVLNLLSDYDSRIIFVDDGSKDETLNIIKRFADSDSRVKYISFSRNFGKEAAMLAGLRFSSADLVGIIDADLQHSPNLIPEMLASLEGDYDVAAAKRADRKGESKFRSSLSDSFYKVANRMTEIKIDPNAQDFRIMKRKVVDAILSMTEYNRFTKGIFSFVGFRTKWFEHENRQRAAGETKWNIRKLFSYAFDGILGYSSVLLKLPLVIGLLMLCGGLIYAVVSLIAAIVSPAPLSVVHPLLSVIFIIDGLILISIGIAGEYLARVYGEVRNRPVFIVDETNITK